MHAKQYKSASVGVAALPGDLHATKMFVLVTLLKLMTENASSSTLVLTLRPNSCLDLAKSPNITRTSK